MTPAVVLDKNHIYCDGLGLGRFLHHTANDAALDCARFRFGGVVL